MFPVAPFFFCRFISCCRHILFLLGDEHRCFTIYAMPCKFSACMYIRHIADGGMNIWMPPFRWVPVSFPAAVRPGMRPPVIRGSILVPACANLRTAIYILDACLFPGNAGCALDALRRILLRTSCMHNLQQLMGWNTEHSYCPLI